MSDLRKLVKDIDRGISLRTNWKKYVEVLSDTYFNYCAVELTFSLYLLEETVREKEYSSDELAIYEECKKYIASMLAGEEWQALEGEWKEIRKNNTTAMEEYTTYVDCLVPYEQVIRRMELRYEKDAEKEKWVKSISEDEFVKRLVYFVAGNQDKSIVRDRLQMLIGMLPVHMTKNKLMEHISEAATLYKGSDMAALDGFAYMIRSAGMLHERKVSEKEPLKSMGQWMDELEQMDFANLDADTYSSIKEELARASESIVELTDYRYALQKVINSAYAFSMMSQMVSDDSEVVNLCKSAIKQVLSQEASEECLVPLEGKIEVYVENVEYLESVLFQNTETQGELLEELGLQNYFETFHMVALLRSDSVFVELDSEERKTIVGEEQVKEVVAELSTQLSQRLSGMNKLVKRAVMAAVLEKLPTSFQGTNELQEYIHTNLFGCQDFAEKAFVLAELEEMMRDAEKWQ